MDPRQNFFSESRHFLRVRTAAGRLGWLADLSVVRCACSVTAATAKVFVRNSVQLTLTALVGQTTTKAVRSRLKPRAPAVLNPEAAPRYVKQVGASIPVGARRRRSGACERPPAAFMLNLVPWLRIAH